MIFVPFYAQENYNGSDELEDKKGLCHSLQGLYGFPVVSDQAICLLQ